MRILCYLLIITLTACDASKSDKPASEILPTQSNSRAQDSIATIAIVHDFFTAFDDKDIKRMHSLLSPSMKITHHNGATTNTAEMMKVIEETKDWWPRTRTLSNFEFISNGNLAIVGLKNEVTFSLPTERKVYEPYQETWIFEKANGKWMPIRCHYSKITVEKHTENVE